MSKKQTGFNSQERSDFQSLFAGDLGQKVLRAMMERNNIFTTSHSSYSQYDSAFQEGRRAAILDILTMVMGDVNPDHFAAEMRHAKIETFQRTKDVADRVDESDYNPLEGA